MFAAAPFVRLAVALAVASSIGTAIAAEGAAKAPARPDAAKGQEKATAVCAACHTADGSRGTPANPILAGQHPEYIVKQLQEFKAGKRVNAIMQGMAAALTDDDMRNIAAFYAGKQAKPGAAKSKELAALGEKIYRGGIADRNVPACAGCHAPTGLGIPSQFPRLAGQHADYTEAQMLAFRDGVRKNNAIMSGVAAKMNDREIQAVSDYIAGLQ